MHVNTKSTNLRIHELVIFNQSVKIDTHEEKSFHSIAIPYFFVTFASVSRFVISFQITITIHVYDPVQMMMSQ